MALSDFSLIQFTPQTVSLRIVLILPSYLRFGRPIVLFCLGLFIEMLTDVLSHQRVINFSKTSRIFSKINSDLMM